MDIYLTSDNENLRGSVNGYFVRIGNTQDEVSLYKQSGEKSSSIKIIDGLDDRVNSSQVELNIKVTKDQNDTWELLVDSQLTGNYISEGTVQNSDHFFSNYFGILCACTSTRSDKFFFDDLVITGEAYIDNDPPAVDSIAVLSDSTLHLFFNEKIRASSAGDVLKFAVDQTIGNPFQIQTFGDSSVLLYFQNRFTDKATYELTINGIEDLFSNSLNNYTAKFSYHAPYLIGFGDVLITEIMADPTPGVDLPEYEYLEIYNPKSEGFNLNRVKLIVGKDTAVIPDLILYPNEYIILCRSSAIDHFESYGTVVRVPNWPSLNNGEESIILINEQSDVVFSIDYDNSWYKSIEKDDGGWSLEMIDTNFPCKEEQNWIASADPSGGTPGKQNSHKDQLSDLSGPEISRIIANSDTSVIVYLNEKINPQHIKTGNIFVEPQLGLKNAILISPNFQEISIDFSSTINPKTIYKLSINNLSDCIGNLQAQTSSSFVLPEKPDSLDIIINEILFDPWPGGVDFVEIYNQSDKYIDLKYLLIGNQEFLRISEDHLIIEPHQLSALTEDPLVLQNHYPKAPSENLVNVPELPSFNNDEGDIIIADENDNKLDYTYYSDAYHSDFLQDTEGVSLERISYAGPSDNPNNWQSAASTVGFATPGMINSQYLESAQDEGNISVEPKVFDPGSASSNSFAMIKCRFSEPGNMASIKIINASGRLVKTIASHQSIGIEESFKWEGMDDNGQEVRMGYYVVHAEIYNSSGARKLFREKVVVGGRF